MQQEEEAKSNQGGNKSNSQNSQNNQHHVTKWKQETTGDDSQYGEYIDMEMDEDCASDVDSET